MKLLTHNMLTSKFIKGISTGYPLQLTVNDFNISPVDFNVDFLKKILPRINYDVLKATAIAIGHGNGLPNEITQDVTDDDLQKVHRVLLEIDIISGELVCPESGRKFSITDGIANMFERDSDMQIDDE